jgi:F-type H+-transporting ATPase subunit b
MSFLAIDGTLFIQLINFAIFVAVLNVVFLRPVGAAIRKRREYINSLVSDHDRFQAEAKSLREQAESVRAAARRDAEHAIAAERARGSNETAELNSRYAQQAQAIVEEATRTVQAELDAARSGEERVVRQLADLMLDRVIPETVA